jgi:poly-gamma-glutamate system protein
MSWVEARVGLPRLACVAAAALLALAPAEWSAGRERAALRAEATQVMSRALSALHDERLARGLGFTPDDVDRTGVVGEEMSPLVTTLGVLPAKRLAADPRFAALVLDLFRQAGVRRGDAIAAGFSGSLPGLNIAVLAAAHALGAVPVVIASVGASSWGATEPGWTWLDMEAALRARGVFAARSIAAAKGGGVRHGFLLEEGKAVAERAIRRSGVPEIAERTHRDQVDRHLAAYRKAAAGRPIAIFVNVGGSSINLGSCGAVLLPPGILRRVPGCPADRQGLIHRFASTGVPVIHLLNVRRLAKERGLTAVAPPPGAPSA